MVKMKDSLTAANSAEEMRMDYLSADVMAA
jgi:hypothetical protein